MLKVISLVVGVGLALLYIYYMIEEWKYRSKVRNSKRKFKNKKD